MLFGDAYRLMPQQHRYAFYRDAGTYSLEQQVAVILAQQQAHLNAIQTMQNNAAPPTSDQIGQAAVKGVQLARPLANPCVIAGFYLASASGGAGSAPELFAETKTLVASIPTSVIISTQSWLYRQTLTGAAGTYTLFRLASAGVGKVASGCNAME